MGTYKLYCVLTGEHNPPIQLYDDNLERLDTFLSKHKITMGHWKFTCPNPHSGERVYGQRIWGFVIDLDNKAGLFMTSEEYELSWDFDTAPKAKIEFDKLMESDPFYDFRGILTGNKYGL
jgi:hypothetical protein